MNGTHDLEHLVRQARTNMLAEYERMRGMAKKDPGTSGDQGEENWAELLYKWLPGTFHIVTKGRIISSAGQTSPQMDVLVLSPSYLMGLLSNKLYIAAGVVAAFECKRTLRRERIQNAVRTSVKLSRMTRSDEFIRHHIQGYSGRLFVMPNLSGTAACLHEGWPVSRNDWVTTHQSKKQATVTYYTTGFDREEIIDLCIRINSVERVAAAANWPPCLGLYKSVVVTLTYARHNRTQSEIGESFGVSQSTVSRAISAITPLIPEAVREFVPTADDLDLDAPIHYPSNRVIFAWILFLL